MGKCLWILKELIQELNTATGGERSRQHRLEQDVEPLATPLVLFIRRPESKSDHSLRLATMTFHRTVRTTMSFSNGVRAHITTFDITHVLDNKWTFLPEQGRSKPSPSLVQHSSKSCS